MPEQMDQTSHVKHNKIKRHEVQAERAHDGGSVRTLSWQYFADRSLHQHQARALRAPTPYREDGGTLENGSPIIVS